MPYEMGAEKGFKAGLTVVHETLEELEGRQLVGITNGQYTLKDEIMAGQWADAHGVEYSSEPVFIGDQAGFNVPFGDHNLTTADRAPAIQATEAAVAYRVLENYFE
jgi:hypothetical protein